MYSQITELLLRLSKVNVLKLYLVLFPASTHKEKFIFKREEVYSQCCGIRDPCEGLKGNKTQLQRDRV